MEKNQSDFIFNWARLCKHEKNPKIPCIVTWWDCNTANERLNIALKGKVITVYGTDIESWLACFRELSKKNKISLINKGGSAVPEYPRFDFDYIFVSEIIINEFLD